MSQTNIYILNDTVVELRALKNAVTDEYVNDATVTVTIKDILGSAVTGLTFPITLTYVTGSNGIYRATLDKALSLSDGLSYFAEITAASGGVDGFWRVPLIAGYRES